MAFWTEYFASLNPNESMAWRTTSRSAGRLYRHHRAGYQLLPRVPALADEDGPAR